MTKQEERIIERLSSIQELIANRNPQEVGQSTYAYYNRIMDRFRDTISAMKSYNMDIEGHTKLKTTLDKLVERIDRESRIEALELHRALVVWLDGQGYFNLCWQVYCTVREIHQPRLLEVLPAHLRTAVIMMS